MVRLHELKPGPGAKKARKRVGRGPGSGWGKTSGKGQKGQKVRSGGGKGLGFEGGQTPLQRRVPKLPGFKNPFKKRYAQVNVVALNTFREGAVVSPEKLLEKRLIRKGLPVKILAEGNLEKKLKVKAHAFSRQAVKKIEEAGGTAEVM